MDRLPQEGLQSGDLIFRSGTGMAGQLLAEAAPKTSYSHVGLVTIKQGAPFVIHASLGGENGKGQVIIDSLEDFLLRDKAIAVAVYRLPSDLVYLAPSAIEIAQNYVRQEVPFDTGFDLSNDERLYCTELVWRAYQEAGLNLVEGKIRNLVIPFAENGRYILPSHLLDNSRLKLIVSIPN